MFVFWFKDSTWDDSLFLYINHLVAGSAEVNDADKGVSGEGTTMAGDEDLVFRIK